MIIPLSRPPVDDEIKAAVLAAIDSGRYILGPQCREFEAEFARYVGTRHAVLTASGTAALWLAHTLDPADAAANLRFNEIQAAVIRTPQRDALARFLKERGIQTGIHYPVPCHRQPAVERLTPPTLHRTEQIAQEILTLPLSAGHTDAEVDHVATVAREFFSK